MAGVIPECPSSVGWGKSAPCWVRASSCLLFRVSTAAASVARVFSSLGRSSQARKRSATLKVPINAVVQLHQRPIHTRLGRGSRRVDSALYRTRGRSVPRTVPALWPCRRPHPPNPTLRPAPTPTGTPTRPPISTCRLALPAEGRASLHQRPPLRSRVSGLTICSSCHLHSHHHTALRLFRRHVRCLLGLHSTFESTPHRHESSTSTPALVSTLVSDSPRQRHRIRKSSWDEIQADEGDADEDGMLRA